MKNLLILGSTGSIGRQALSLIEDTALGQKYIVYGLTAYGKNVETIIEQVGRYKPKRLAVYSRSVASELKQLLGPRAEVLWGDDGVETLSKDPNVDVVLSGIAGTAALKPTFAAVRAGKTIALANKESLVSMGALMIGAAKESGATILPVDSEHSAI
ncbi:MAG: 1-deoxy-D-xylulose-5-phosphate reductoisomerase, partial [bacterium]